MSTVFISYRREDAPAHAGRIRDRLLNLFGANSVFMDVQDIYPGADYREVIQRTIARCDALLAVIGPHWLSSLRERAAGPEDLVVTEIAAGFSAKVAVIPVLVGGAAMPNAEDLPEPLRALTRPEALEIRDARFDDGFQQLLTALQTRSGLSPVDLTGRWVAEMQRTDDFAVAKGFPPFRDVLDLYVVDGAISGSVSYPTGTAVIEEGSVTGKRIAFRTSHVPQFETRRAIIRFMGEIVKDELHLRAVDEHGIVCSGIARRRRPAS